MTDRYVVEVFDLCGARERIPCDGFASALDVYGVKLAEYKGVKIGGLGTAVTLVNEDTVDIDCRDGLTEEEREQVDAVG